MPQARDEAGNIWETDAQGNPVRLIQAAPQQGRVFADPVAPFEVPKAQADIANVQTNIADTRADNAREDLKLKADLLKQGLRLGANGQVERITGFKPVVDPPDPLKLSQFRALEQQIARVEELFNAGPGATSGVRGLADFVPDRFSDSNAAFNSAAAGLGEVGLAAFRVPGVGSQSEAELRQFVAANTPRASDNDAAIQEKLGNLKRRLAATKQELGIDVAPEQQSPDVAPPQAAGAGATETSVPIPPEMQREHAAWIAQNAGNITPDSYAAFRTSLDRKFGFEPNTDAYRRAAPAINEAAQQGQINPAIPPVNRELSAVEQFRNEVVSNPAVTTGVGFAEGISAGGVSALDSLLGDGGRVNALREESPLAFTLGEIGGAIPGTFGLAGIGRNTIGRALPGLLGGGGKSQFARNIATDAAFSGVLGANQGQDALDSTVLGGLGSASGGLLGKTIGKAVGGAELDDAVKFLRERGIPLTTGQTLGGIARTTEDKFTSLPVIDDIVRARRGEAGEQVVLEAFKDAGRPIGFTPTRIGEEGVFDLIGNQARGIPGAAGQAREASVAGLDIPIDNTFIENANKAIASLGGLPGKAKRPITDIVNARINPIIESGSLTGPVFTATRSALKEARNNVPPRIAGFEPEFRGVTSDLIGALDNQVSRGASPDVLTNLDNANQAFRMGKILDDATQRASATGFVPTPAQLQSAIKLANKKFPGLTPFSDLANAAQKVLPSRTPDSGSIGRGAQIALGGGLIGGGATIGAGFGADEGLAGATEGAGTGALSTASLLAALAFLGTKGGQKALNNIIATRPDALRTAGRAIGRNAGIFGSATIPLTVGNQ